MPLSLQWVADPSTPGRSILRGTNNTLTSIHDTVVNVPTAGRSFNYPGPMAIGATHDYWNPLPSHPNDDIASMTVSYYTVLDIQITEPLI